MGHGRATQRWPPILSLLPLTDTICLSTSMSGALTLLVLDKISGRLMGRSSGQWHTKYAVQVSVKEYQSSQRRHGTSYVIATAGWDQKVNIHLLHIVDTPGEQAPLLTAPIHSITLASNPESIAMTRHPDTGHLYLILSRRDSTFLYFYLIREQDDGELPSVSVVEEGRQNLAPHSNAWIGFTPSYLAVCPTDPSLLAIGTSHLPHMKAIVVRLLFPGSSNNHIDLQHQSQASLARASLAIEDREERAMSLFVTTMAPQTPYSTPQIVWRPNGKGLWVNGDDGVIRGIDVQSGKVVASLKAHEPGTKVRTLWAGTMDQREVLISGGFDKSAFVWGVDDDAVAE